MTFSSQWGTPWSQHQQEQSNPFRELFERQFRLETLEGPFSLGDFPPIQIELDAFPANKFIVRYFEVLWRNITKIGKFYSTNATMTVHIDDTFVNSPLSRFSPNSRDLVNEEPGPVYIGRAAIALQICRMFPKGFFSSPTSINAHMITPDCAAVMIVGVVQDTSNHVYGFVKSLAIAVGKECYIVNENLLLTKINSNKGSSMNSQELVSIRPIKEDPLVQHEEEKQARQGKPSSFRGRAKFRGRGRGRGRGGG